MPIKEQRLQTVMTSQFVMNTQDSENSYGLEYMLTVPRTILGNVCNVLKLAEEVELDPNGFFTQIAFNVMTGAQSAPLDKINFGLHVITVIDGVEGEGFFGLGAANVSIPTSSVNSINDVHDANSDEGWGFYSGRWDGQPMNSVKSISLVAWYGDGVSVQDAEAVAEIPVNWDLLAIKITQEV